MQSRALHGLCETGLNQTAIGKLIPGRSGLLDVPHEDRWGGDVALDVFA